MSALLKKAIEQTLYRALATQAILKGYRPDDIAIAATYGETPTGQEVYQSELSLIKTTRGWACDVFGFSNSQVKGTKLVPRLVLVGHRFMPGDLGVLDNISLTLNPNDPTQTILTKESTLSSYFQFDVHIITKTAEQDNLLHEMVNDALGVVQYIPISYENLPGQILTGYLFLKQYNYFDLPDTQEGINERVYSYEIPDMFLGTTTTIAVNPATIKEINVDIFPVAPSIPTIPNGTTASTPPADSMVVISPLPPAAPGA